MRRCSKCHERKPPSAFYRSGENVDGLQSRCKPCHVVAMREYRHRHPDRIREYQRRAHQKNRVKRNAGSRLYYARNAERARTRARERIRVLKDAAYAAYGGYVCRCCGETEVAFLCVDHVNNDGYAHRKAVPAHSLYFWLAKEGYPAGFQILCMNCNHGKRINGGVCPHRSGYGIAVREVSARRTALPRRPGAPAHPETAAEVG